jgi:hypothetical protein
LTPLAVLVSVALAAAGIASASGSDRAYARRINLRLGDFPAGWTAGGNAGSHAKCTQPDTARLRVLATVRSPRFRRNANTVIQSRSYVLPSAGQAVTLMRRWAGLGYGACLRASLATVGKVSKLSSSPLSFDRLGSRTSARRVFAHFRVSDGSAANVYSDYIFVQKGRAVAGFNFAFVGYKPPLWLERKLTRAAVGRM